MDKLNFYLLLSFILLFILVAITLYKIDNFMTVYDTCKDDFAVITKCRCIPWPNGQ